MSRRLTWPPWSTRSWAATGEATSSDPRGIVGPVVLIGLMAAMPGMKSGVGMGMGSSSSTWHALLVAWPIGPWAAFALIAEVLAGWWYLRAVRRLAARGRPWSRRRTWAFLSGLVALGVALESPVATLTDTSFVFHIYQHLLVMLIAPPLLALGGPMTLALQTSPRAVKRRLLWALRSWPARVASFPVLVAALYYGSMFVFFLTPLLGIAMRHMALMDAVNIHFLIVGYLFWWSIIGLEPTPHWRMPYPLRILALFMGVPFESFLGIAIMTTSRPLAPMYSLSSGHTGGGVLWVGAELLTVIPLLVVCVQWSRAEERKAARDDRRLDALRIEQRVAESAGSVATSS